MSRPSREFQLLARTPVRELRRLFASGEPPGAEMLAGHEYLGYNLFGAATPLRMRKFVKAFFRTGDGRVFGCNTPVTQNGLDQPWLHQPNANQPKRWAFFSVEPPDPAGSGPWRHSVLLDYGRGGNPPYRLEGRLRDHVVRVEPDSDELLLGFGQLVAGPVRTPPAFFILTRGRELPDAHQLAERVLRAAG